MSVTVSEWTDGRWGRRVETTYRCTKPHYKMEDGMDIEEHDLLNNPTVRSVFPDLAVLKQEIIDFDISEVAAPETLTTSPQVSKRNENKNQLHNLTVYSGDHPTECSTQDLDVKPDHLCTDMDDTITVKGNILTEFHEIETKIKKESENVPNELPFYRNRIIFGKIHVDESDEEREIDAPGDCNNVVNNKTNNDQDLAGSIYTDVNGSMRITKQYYEMEKCFGAKIILKNCYTTLLNHNCYCAQCAVLFPTTEAYSEHYTSTHTETTHSTKASVSLVNHKKIIYPREKAFVCDTCKRTFSKKKYLIQHMVIHTGEKPFQCDICTKTFRRRRYLKSHNLRHTEKKPFQCETCKKTFRYISALQQHKLIHAGEKPFQCDICKKSFNHRSAIKRHKLIHTGEKPFQCDICTKTFYLRFHLKSHKLIHTGEKPFQCETCKKTFIYILALKKHKLIHTGQKPFQCDICSKTFQQISHLKGHKLIHTGEKPFQCETCKKTFRYISALKQHKLIHTGEKPFQCDICSKTFKQISHLKGHKLTHTGEKPYMCGNCKKSFRHISTLKSHELIHTGEKPFQCDICTKSFNHRSNHKRHMLTHTEAKPFPCETCNKNFKQISDLKRHNTLAKHHSSVTFARKHL
ncbi:zinc finger protein 714 isoform X1 [Plutella xylostella]|uniref:zinc finger protein 714 isoform X1 n=2 Tax=Plutella xylostella TaxID=51655 RepID=UPI00203248CF|nr:zinc finger protein 714 isoform X1 [Plutella xylostella]